MAVTDYQSLYGICNKVALSGVSSLENIGGYETYIDLYSQDDIDKNYNDIVQGNYDEYNNLITKCSFGSDEDQSHVILVASDNVEIPENYTLTPINPKKSLVVLCNKFINNGTISMTAKGPNILPHEWYIIGQSDGYDEDIIIPAYANNQTEGHFTSKNQYGEKGNNGVNHQCGAGGIGGNYVYDGANSWFHTNGSGTAFAGGGGSGSCITGYNQASSVGAEPDSTYPMKGGNGLGFPGSNTWRALGGTGNTCGYSSYHENYGGNSRTQYDQNFGVGGRIIIFCTTFVNNGTISANGTDANTSADVWGGAVAYGGASGGGAIDIFYNKTQDETNFGNVTTTGGLIGSIPSGGDGAITTIKYNASSFILPGYANKETIGEVIRLTKLALKEKVAKDELASLILEDTYTSLTKTYSSQKIEEAILALIDDTQVASMLTNKTLSSQMIQLLMPKLVSQLENDKGYIAREISAVEVNNIWDNVFGV